MGNESVLYILVNEDLTNPESEYQEVGKLRITLELNEGCDLNDFHFITKSVIESTPAQVAVKCDNSGGHPISVLMTLHENQVPGEF